MKYLALIILSTAIMVPLNAEETCDSGDKTKKVTTTVRSHLRDTVKSVCNEEFADIEALSKTVNEMKAQIKVNKAEVIKVQ